MEVITPLASVGFTRRSQLAFLGLIVAGFVLAASTARAVVREYEMVFGPSPSGQTIGYLIYVGFESQNYFYNFDIGSPPASGGTLVYSLDLEDSLDLYIALAAYDEEGRVSPLSNELVVEAIDPGTGGGGGGSTGGGSTGGGSTGGGSTGGGSTGGGSTGGGSTGGGSTGGGPAPTPLMADLLLGVNGGSDGLVSMLAPNGGMASMTMDSLAAAGDLRPTTCDLDGDGDRDLVIGFGRKSEGQVAIVFLEDGAVASVSTLETGTEDYRRKDGETFPACGDLDGDGLGEIVVGFDHRMEDRVQLFDDPNTGFAPLVSVRSDARGLLRVPTPQKFKGELHPAVGDVDGDGRDELVVGMGKTRFGHLVVLDDAGADFGLHMGNRTGEPWLTLDIGLRSARGRYETFPALGDLDGDGRDEIVVSFTRGSGARVALLDDAVDGFPATPTSLYTLQTGRDRYARKNGETRAAIADLDGDGMDEIVVGFSKRAANEVQVFDDVMQALRPMHTADGFVTSPDPNVEIVPAPTR